ncbi:hypothetical protein FJK98_21430 [Micromonospora sp. HM134]|nr:hypothetical protein FJK98_21430 [Micromonospora sp. HM134]
MRGVEGGEAAAGRLLDRGVTAVVCASGLMAPGATRAARQRGLSVPGDVPVGGDDDSPLMAFTDPLLTPCGPASANPPGVRGSPPPGRQRVPADRRRAARRRRPMPALTGRPVGEVW